MRMLVTLLALGTTLLALGAPEPQPLWTEVPALWDVVPSLQPTPKQTKILDRIKASPATVELVVVTFHPEGLDNPSKALVLPLPGDKTAILTDYQVTAHDGYQTLSWNGGDPLRSALLTIDSRVPAVVGLVYYDGKVYSLEPIGDGLQAVVQIDQSRFPHERD